MTHPALNLTRPLKIFLWFTAAVFALAAVVLIFFSTSAATGTGSTPALAVTLIEGANTGLLAAKDQRWFRLISGPNSPQEQFLSLIFTPNTGQNIHLQLFAENQLPLFYFGDTSRMANIGAGQIVTRDNNPETGELFWTGWLPGQQNFYVQLLNGSDGAIDYWLFPQNVTGYNLGETNPAMAAVAAPQNASPAVTGNASLPQPLHSPVTHSSLSPASTHWYTLARPDSAQAGQFVELSFTLFFTPGDGERGQQVHFELYPAQALAQWQRGETAQLVNFGAGSLVSRDGDPNTGELIWRGVILRDETYLVAIENGSAMQVDYWLFEGDIEHPQLSH